MMTNKKLITAKRSADGSSTRFRAVNFCFLIILIGLVTSASLTSSTATAKSITVLEDTIYVEFEGLFFFAFPPGTSARPQQRSECKVGIVSSREDHLFSIEITYKNTTDTKTYIFTHSALQTLPSDIWIMKIPDLSGAADKGVRIQGDGTRPVPEIGWGKPYNRDLEPMKPGPYKCADPSTNDVQCAFNWIIDFEGSELHNGPLREKSDTIRPKLHITTGTFFTLELSDPFYTLKDGRMATFGRVASKTGAKITMIAGESLVILLDRPIIIDNPSTISRIILRNMRPDPDEFRAASTQTHQVQAQQHTRSFAARTPSDDLQVYYDDLFEGFANRRDRFLFIPAPAKPLKASDPFVCYGSGGGTWP